MDGQPVSPPTKQIFLNFLLLAPKDELIALYGQPGMALIWKIYYNYQGVCTGVDMYAPGMQFKELTDEELNK